MAKEIGKQKKKLKILNKNELCRINEKMTPNICSRRIKNQTIKQA